MIDLKVKIRDPGVIVQKSAQLSPTWNSGKARSGIINDGPRSTVPQLDNPQCTGNEAGLVKENFVPVT